LCGRILAVAFTSLRWLGLASDGAVGAEHQIFDGVAGRLAIARLHHHGPLCILELDSPLASLVTNVL
jgi:hypothetical protein